METITQDFLREVTLENHQEFYDLMWRIYPPEYAHFWKNEDCTFYINNQFSKETLSKELKEKQLYYFVVENNENVGILRLKFDEFPNKTIDATRVIKLHRIYLDPKVQGKGLGTKTLNFIDEVARLNNYKYIWLNAMLDKPSAVSFYLKNGYKVFDMYHYDFDLIKPELRQMMAFGKEVFNS